MYAWKGWTPAFGTGPNVVLTWAEWCAWQRHALHLEQRRQQGYPFSERELAYLSFVRWQVHMGRRA